MANFVLLLAGSLVVWFVVANIRRHRRGIVAERGTSIGADLGALNDQPRVRVRSVTASAPDRVRLVLTPEPGPVVDLALATSPDLDLLVALHEDEFGYELLHEWERSQRLIAIVLPPGSRLVRLRAIDDLQPLTLRRLDQG